MTDPLSKLPLFASDQEIAVAIVGRSRADQWRRGTLPMLEARGFPKVDPLHGGRPVPLVRHYYDAYLGLAEPIITAGPDGEEDLESWTRKKARRGRQNDRRQPT